LPLEFQGAVPRQETRVMGLHCGEDCVILSWTVFDWSTRVTNRQTDGRWHRARYSIICYRALKTRLIDQLLPPFERSSDIARVEFVSKEKNRMTKHGVA